MNTFRADWPQSRYLLYMSECGFTKREKAVINYVRDDELMQFQIANKLMYADKTISRDVRKIKSKIRAYESATGLPPC